MLKEQGCYKYTTCVRSHNGKLQLGYTKAAQTPQARRREHFTYNDDMIDQEHEYISQKLEAVLEWCQEQGEPHYQCMSSCCLFKEQQMGGVCSKGAICLGSDASCDTFSAWLMMLATGLDREGYLGRMLHQRSARLCVVRDEAGQLEQGYSLHSMPVTSGKMPVSAVQDAG